ncbi:alpha/beta hydrolase [Micromonospora craniellae]|uniref:Alpha/beta hydrolase n=1 Tax=Micromonospora craniellae TaxID=2294034 RepID=A0A372FQP6_9ACTN|nr:alpha/beta hydrolase [Micromonospora craniellae]QOC90683.1 alpha/beta fold hydrolase [Micromonospora craniellae]RFS39011.1 alpha/beta hydrolase [Micromonospora craniellae]
MRRQTLTGTAVAALATVVALGITPAQANPRTEAPAAGTGIAWEPCADEPEAECGSVTVPVDWSEPDGPTIDIALARRAATDPTARIGTILTNPGGPGASGLQDAILGGIGGSFSDEVRRRFDVVGFDPRGVGGSDPIRCQVPEGPEPELFPTTAEEFDGLRAWTRAYGESCREHSGPHVDFLDSRTVARDMDAIRAALGEKKLTFYGNSYATMMGQQYATLFPQRVRAMVLDSTMDHSAATTWEFLRSETKATQDSFDRYVEWCRSSTECALHGQDARTVFRDLYAKAERGELVDPGSSRTMSPTDLLDDIQWTFLGPYWTQLSERLVSLSAGEPGPTTDAARPTTARTAITEQEPEQEPGQEPVEDPSLAIFCQDWRLPVRDVEQLRAYQDRLAEVAPEMKVNLQAWGSTMACLGWPTEVRNPQAPLRWKGVPPVLVLNSRYDPVTPHEWARNVARQSGATLLTYDGAGHGVYSFGSDCVGDATTRYLIHVKTPPPGTRCPAVEQ